MDAIIKIIKEIIEKGQWCDLSIKFQKGEPVLVKKEEQIKIK